MPAIVQINFPYSESQADLEKHSAEAAPRFSGVEGLQWKVWLVDEAAKTAGGVTCSTIAPMRMPMREARWSNA